MRGMPMSRSIRPLITSLAALALTACAGTPKSSGSETAAQTRAVPTTDLALQSLRKADQALTRNFVSGREPPLGCNPDPRPARSRASARTAAGGDRWGPGQDSHRSCLCRHPPDGSADRRPRHPTDVRGCPLRDPRWQPRWGCLAFLREARIRAEQSSERLAVEQARNRTIAANDELNRGNIAGAQSLVREAMPLLKELGKQQQARGQGTLPRLVDRDAACPARAP